MIKIAIVEDKFSLLNIAKEKISFFDDIKCKYVASNGKEIIDLINRDSILDLVLMDIEMPIMNGIEATEIIKKNYPQIKVIMLTVFDNDDQVFNAIKAGADGYLLKDTGPQELYNGIINTLNGGAIMTPSIAQKTLNLLRNPIENILNNNKEEFTLTEREIEVLEQLSKGLKYQKIADNLVLSLGTIRKHVENIYTKLKVHSKIEAVEKARKNNLI